jgi:hypothetical protein
MTTARFKSGLSYKIKKEMSHVYLEDLEDAIETTIWFQLFVKFKEKSMIFKTKYNAKLPRLHVTRTAQQKQPVKTPKQ